MSVAAASSLYGRYLEPIGSGFLAVLVVAAVLTVVGALRRKERA